MRLPTQKTECSRPVEIGTESESTGWHLKRLDFEKLDVYRCAMDFAAIAQDLVEELPRGRGKLGDQLDRASLSIPLNIAVGAGESKPAEKLKFYRYARRSATECARHW